MGARKKQEMVIVKQEFTVHDEEVVSNSLVSVTPSSLRLVYKVWSTRFSLEVPARDGRQGKWEASVSGKCHPGSNKKTGTITFFSDLQDVPGYEAPDWILKIVDDNRPSFLEGYGE